MNKHTPGPWTLLIGEHNGRWVIKSHPEQDLETGIIVALVPLGPRFNESGPNAHLITAAPELLRVAQASKELLVTLYPIFESIDKASTNTDYAKGMKTIIGTLKLVIEKAEGKE